MLGIVGKAWKAWRGQRALSKSIRKEAKMGKPWYQSTQVWGNVLKLVSLGLGVAHLNPIPPEKLDALTAALVAIGNHVPGVFEAAGVVVGQVVELWGKRKHTERVAIATGAVPK